MTFVKEFPLTVMLTLIKQTSLLINSNETDLSIYYLVFLIWNSMMNSMNH